MIAIASNTSQQSRHANQARIVIGGETIAELTSVSVSQNGGSDATHVIGTPKALEHVHNRETIQGSIGRIVFKRGAGRQFNLNGLDLLAMEPFDIIATDVADGQELFNVIGCTLTNRDAAVNANQRIVSNMQFMALDIDAQGKRATYPVNQFLTTNTRNGVISATISGTISTLPLVDP